MTLSAADFELLLQANRILSSKLDSADVLQAVMELATKVVRAEASSLLLLDESRGELYFDVALGSAKESVKQIRLKVGEGVAGTVAKDRRPLIVNDVSQDKRFTTKVDKSTSFKTKSILAIPLLAKGKLIGVVEAINKEHNGAFTDQDLEAFEVFGSQSAIAIENARLFSEISREKEKLNTIFTQMAEGIVLLDAEQRVLFVNESASRFFGLPLEKIQGQTFNGGLLPEFQTTPALSEIPEFSMKLTPMELARSAGKDLMLSAVFLELEPDRSKKKQGHLMIIRDATEEKRGEMLKRNFLSLISHKLKTPLTVIVGYAPLLAAQSEKMPESMQKAIRSISDQGAHLSGLVDKLLRFTLIESESLDRKIEMLSLSDVIQEAIKSMEEEIHESNVDVKISDSILKMPKVPLDAGLMKEVVKNIIENAIKFNDKSEKKIVIEAEKKKEHVLLRITDNGVGIPPEEKEKVFQKFYQVENSFTGQVPGAGLGLALCKKVIEALGGLISIESKIGKGATVFISLPLEKTTRKKS